MNRLRTSLVLFLFSGLSALGQSLLFVDDDSAQCPGALSTIQDAVAAAPAGATILVCRGTYHHTVNIIGHGKDDLRLIAIGRDGEVVLQGDHTERDGFYLEEVDNVLLRGFTVRDFGNVPTTSTIWGAGNNIMLMNANYTTIEHNILIDTDMMGIMLVDSAHNLVQYNLAMVTDDKLANCGIHVQGVKSASNYIRLNTFYNNEVAGIMLVTAGSGNVVVNNTVVSNGKSGIFHRGTEGTRIEGNRVSYNRGPWGTTPYPQQVMGIGDGIYLKDSDKVTVIENRVSSNSGLDINWDGKGEITFRANSCNTTNGSSVCGR